MQTTVFQIVARIAMGGSERVAANIVANPSAKVRYHVIEVIKDNDAVTERLLEELHSVGTQVHRSCITEHKLAILLFPFRMLWLMLRYRADIIHTHTEVPDVSVYLWHKLFGIFFPHTRFVRTIHSTKLWTSWKGIGKHVESFFHRHHANVAIGKQTAQSYQREYGETVPIIPNGVQELQQRPFPGLVAGFRNILFAGRMEPEKGIKTLVETVKRLSEEHDIIFHIIGTGSLREMVQRELGDLPTVRMCGGIPALASCLGGLDAIFMPSEFEGLALFSLESTMAGVPVIANRCPGLEETLPPDWPLMAEGNNTDTYVRLMTAHRSTEERSALVASAQSYVHKNYSVSTMCEGYERLYLN